MDYSVRRKELYVYICTKSIIEHVLVLWLESTQFFLFSLFLSLIFLSLFLSLAPPFFLPSYYILWLFLLFPPSTCGLGVESPFSPSLLSFLESSILSYKPACSLFRYHLHINAAKRLAGRHLMRRWQYPQIFVIPHSYPLFDIFPFILLQGLSKALF